LTGFIAANMAAAIVFDQPYPYPDDDTFDSTARADILENINSVQPQIVLLGDSTLVDAVDVALFEKKIGLITTSLERPGGASALWMLQLKNIILSAQARPAYVVVLFRGTMLTVPDFRTQGDYFPVLDEIATPQDRWIYNLAVHANRTDLERLLEIYLPLYKQRTAIYNAINDLGRYALPMLRYPLCDPACIDKVNLEVFHTRKNDMLWDQRIAAAEEYLYQRDHLNFYGAVQRSFLPPMLQYARDNCVRMVFVDYKTRPQADNASSNPSLDAYTRDLAVYLREQGAAFIDFQKDARITPDFFKDSFHFADGKDQLFTPIFAAELQKIIDNPLPGSLPPTCPAESHP
jgi:hypothetical protein